MLAHSPSQSVFKRQAGHRQRVDSGGILHMFDPAHPAVTDVWTVAIALFGEADVFHDGPLSTRCACKVPCLAGPLGAGTMLEHA